MRLLYTTRHALFCGVITAVISVSGPHGSSLASNGNQVETLQYGTDNRLVTLQTGVANTIVIQQTFSPGTTPGAGNVTESIQNGEQLHAFSFQYGGTASSVYQNQSGTLHHATATQNATTTSRIHQSQSGSALANTAIATQNSGLVAANNSAWQEQRGSNNFAQLSQTGGNPGDLTTNPATPVYGAYQNQDGDNNTSTIEQTGGEVGNLARVTETGDSNRADITQSGDDLDAAIAITGVFNNADIDQWASGNFARISISGSDNGFSKPIAIIQSGGSGNQAWIDILSGDDNKASILQNGTGNSASITIQSSANIATISQTGYGNLATVRQR